MGAVYFPRELSALKVKDSLQIYLKHDAYKISTRSKPRTCFIPAYVSERLGKIHELSYTNWIDDRHFSSIAERNI